MDYNPGGGGNFHMMCEYCGTVAEYSADDADDGLFSCPRCYAVHTHTSTQAAATNHADVPAAASGDLAGARDKRRRVGGAGGLGGAGVGAPGDDDPALAAAAAAAGGADGAAPAERARVRRRRRRRRRLGPVERCDDSGAQRNVGAGRAAGGRGPRRRGGRDASFIGTD